jgi:hypothetical protein
MSIIEVVLFNLLPAPVAAPVMNMIKDIIPMLSILLIRISLYTALGFQKLHNSMTQKIQLARLFRMYDNFSLEYTEKIRA